ncbi:MAG TPA: phosphatase PAP2 family protein [Solirubrobacterales bacterium]|nr:phosphatase PAP2 family protein [Solirubrobacterales bacterium]
MSRALERISTRLPQGWGDAGRQLGILALVDFAYEMVRGVADTQRSVAIVHGQEVIEFEQSIHTFFEPRLQALFLPAHWLIDFANQVYLNAQFSIALGFLIWLYLFRNDSYCFVRNMFVVSMSLALIGYTLFPTAPPRMFPEHGFIDTVNAFSGVNHNSALAKLFINPYAAIPSMHCAFALMIGGSGVMVCRRRYTRAFWAAWPLLVTWVVIVTANHFWTDAVLGWAVAVSSALVAARVLARARPDAWSWRSNSPREVEV